MVYWEDESSVTAVPSDNVKNKVVGEISSVKLGKEKFQWEIALFWLGYVNTGVCNKALLIFKTNVLKTLFIEGKFDPLNFKPATDTLEQGGQKTTRYRYNYTPMK